MPAAISLLDVPYSRGMSNEIGKGEVLKKKCGDIAFKESDQKCQEDKNANRVETTDS